jgi:hypothetical protein
MQNKIIKQLQRNKKNSLVGGEVFNIEIPEDEIKRGMSFQEIANKMKEASSENLIRFDRNASFSS